MSILSITENLRNCHGQYTQEHVKKLSVLVGQYGQWLDQVHVGQFGESFHYHGHGDHVDFTNNIKQFVQEYKDDQLFHCIPGRKHSAFPKFVANQPLWRPDKLAKRLVAYSEKLDVARSLLL